MEAAAPAWPASPCLQGQLLFQQCTKMVVDVHACAQANVEVAAALVGALPVPDLAVASSVHGVAAPSTRECGTASTAQPSSTRECGAASAAQPSLAVGGSGDGGVVHGGTVEGGSNSTAAYQGGVGEAPSRHQQALGVCAEGKHGQGGGQEKDRGELEIAGPAQKEGTAKEPRAQFKEEQEKEGEEGKEEKEEEQEEEEQEEEEDCGQLIAAANMLSAELQSAAHNVTEYTEEALRGLLYCVLVRHLVLGIAGGERVGGEGQEGS